MDGLVKEPSGKVSFVRISGLLLILTYIAWGTKIVIEKNVIPDLPAYLFWLIASLYGINRVASGVAEALIKVIKSRK